MMKKILVVDDEPNTRSSLKRFLNLSNYDIMVAANGIEALQLYADNTFDLVITDILMPEMDGLEFIQELRQHYNDVKILVMSGVFEIDGIYINCLKHAKMIGADKVLEKPFSTSVLLESIDNLLQ